MWRLLIVLLHLLPWEYMKRVPSISIIIPVFNEADHLESCLKSIMAQTAQPYEVIIVDNNSTDASVLVAKKFKKVKLLQETKQGIVFARNKGFLAAKGDILGRIDADTILPKDWVQKVTAFYTSPNHRDEALTGGGFFYNFRLPRFNGWLFGQLAFRFNRLVIGHYILWGSNMALPRAMWQHVAPHMCLRNDIHEDMDLGIHLHNQGFKITYLEHLRVGVQLKRVWENRWQQRQHLARWPRTLRVHGYKLWWMGSIGNVFLPLVGEPFFFVSEAIARLFGRPKLPR